MLKIHSIETMGTLDGPNIRIVFFLQGCPLRCQYCHNPDTWMADGGNWMSCDEVVRKAIRYRPYFKGDGGVTFSGGEPLDQAKSLLECMKQIKASGIHIVLDTSGVCRNDKDLIPEILKCTDLVILDIKHEDPIKYREITGRSIEDYRYFKAELIKSSCKIWIKHVVIPGITDDVDHTKALEKEVRSFPADRVEKFELLPYHTMGVSKYEALKMDYRLTGVEDMDSEALELLKKEIQLDCLI